MAKKNLKLENGPWDFLGRPVVRTPPSHAGDTGSIPGRGMKIPHASEQQSQLQLCSLCALRPAYHN